MAEDLLIALERTPSSQTTRLLRHNRAMRVAEDVLRWLLEPANPPVRYLTLTDLLGRPEADPEVRSTRAQLHEYPLTQAILGHPGALPLDDERPYWKYDGLYWQLIVLGQFLADGKDPRIAPAVDFVLEHRHWVRKRGWQCLTTNLLGALMRLGYADHPVVIEETEALAQRFVEEDGIDCSEMGYSLLSRCFMALPKLLLCFAEVPVGRRSASVEKAIERITSDLIDKEVFVYLPGHRKAWSEILAGRPRRDELPSGQRVVDWVAARREEFLTSRGPGDRRPKRGWLKFGFPLHYNSDVLEALLGLARVGVPQDPRLDRALHVLRDKRTDDGRWIMERSMNGRMLVDVEALGAPSKWLTYRASSVLEHFEPEEG